jgi:hypothetical protein
MKGVPVMKGATIMKGVPVMIRNGNVMMPRVTVTRNLLCHLPLKRGGRRAQRAGWGSKFLQQLFDPRIPTPTLPFSRGGSAPEYAARSTCPMEK